jgi:hypothetical protein
MMSTPADLQSSLDKLGLGFLFTFLNDLIADPNIDKTDVDAVGRYIDTSPDTKIQSAIKERFIGNEGRVKAGFQPLKPNEYIQAEQSYIDRLKNNGLPQGFYDQPKDLAKLIAGTVSPIEFENRIQQGYLAAQAAPQSVKNQLQSLYGVTESDMAAYFLDPTRAEDVMGRKKSANLFAQAQRAAEIAAQAQTQANIQVSRLTAEELGAQGITTSAAQAGFAEIGAQQELYNPLMGEQAITQEQQIGAALNTNAEARKAVANRRRSRQAAFETGGGFASTQGASALGIVGQ